MGSTAKTYGDVTVDIGTDGVATVEIHRPPSNFFDAQLIRSISEVYEALDEDPSCRAIVLCSEGKHFCAGANFGAPATPAPSEGGTAPDLYAMAVRMIVSKTPVVAAVQGAAIGGGLGLACSADFRVGCSDSRMAANFAQLGFHHGFGLTITLPPIVGQQKAMDMLLTGRRVAGEEAHAMGLLDRFVELAEVRNEAHRMAAEIAKSAPLAVVSIRETMREGIGERYRQATEREAREQAALRATEDFKEGIRASAERRTPEFQGR
jgi:enoyl-CoA hydratase/carnithine racemase